ncbi:MAG: hypothetical protein DRH79_07035 [Candidatus Cloacimonadota bacterium]|nr:MAG: hypothetical protein DRH79_07035 [Candidatus Cloacimonadota bacterium]
MKKWTSEFQYYNESVINRGLPMDELDRILDDIKSLAEKLEQITLKLERHLVFHETTGVNAKWLKWFFDFARTALLIYLAITGLS